VFTLEERAGGYALSTDEPEPQTQAHAVTPRLRAIGLFTRDGDDGDGNGIVDLFLDAKRSHLKVGVDFQSRDDTWKWSPLSADVDVLRARVEATAGPWTVTGFDNDTTWTSLGPVTLVGDDGVFGYNAGYDRHGVAAALSPSSFFLLRGLVVDHANAADAPPAVIPASVVSAFASGAAGDTTAYAYSPQTRDADQAAVELVIDTGDVDAGYVRRLDRGAHAGVLADLAQGASTLPATVYATRESRDVTLYWARVRSVYGFGVSLGYGRGSSDVDLERRGLADVDSASAIDAGLADRPADARLSLVKSDRASVSVDRRAAGVTWRAWWDYVSLDVDGASSDIHRAGLGASWARGGWTARGDVRTTDQHYGASSADVHVDSPARNVWLYGRDDFALVDIVELDHDRYTDAALQASWAAPDSAAPWRPASVRARIRAAGDGVFGGVSLIEATAGAELCAPRCFYARADGRLASYDRPQWGVSESFLSGWIEVGYRRAALDVNVGYGFDPVVFDPIVNEFRDIGYERWVRRSIDGGVRRGDSADIGRRLSGLERELRAYNSLKLECVIRF
jgi:hypothetical protein